MTDNSRSQSPECLEQDEYIDLLFTDINLPDGPNAIDGLELAQKAVEFRPGLRVIYTTGEGRTDGMTALFVEDATLSSQALHGQTAY